MTPQLLLFVAIVGTIGLGWVEFMLKDYVSASLLAIIAAIELLAGITG